MTERAYFASKNALIAEVYPRIFRAAPLLVDDHDSVPVRVTAQLRHLVMLPAEEPELAAACTIALMGTQTSVRAIRDQIDAEVKRHIRAALGSGAWPEVADALEYRGRLALRRVAVRSRVPGLRMCVCTRKGHRVSHTRGTLGEGIRPARAAFSAGVGSSKRGEGTA
jgi:hypothetical protein